MSGKLMPEDVLRNVFLAITNVDNITIEYVDGVLRIKDDGVSKEKINADVAGNGLGQNVNGSLEVNVDDSTIEINSDILRVKDDGVTGAKINANVVDNSTLEQTGTTLNVKDDGITGAKLNFNVIDNSTLEQTGTTLNIKDLGVSGTKLNSNTYDDISIHKNGSNKLESKQNTYVAYALDVTGVGYTETFSTEMNYIAILKTLTPIETLQASNFTGLWWRIAKFSDAFDYHDANYYDTDEKGLCWAGNFLSTSTGPTAYYFEGTHRRVYFSYYEGRKDSAGNVRGGGRESRCWLSYYDIDTKIFANEVTFTEAFPDSNDLHNVPTLIVNDDGYIIFVKESLEPSGGHNSDVYVWKSDNPEDLSAFTQVATLPGTYAYPNIFKLLDGTIFIYIRKKIGGNESPNGIFKSIDGGSTWKDLSGTPNASTTVLDYDKAGYFGYERTVLCSRAQGINIVLNPDIGVTGNQESVMFLHSDDGQNWENARQFVEGSGGYTHDVIGSGAMDALDLDTNFLVDGPIATPTTHRIMSRTGCLDPDGIPYILGQYATSTVSGEKAKSNVVLNLYLYYYDAVTHAWIKTDIMPNMLRSNTAINVIDVNLSASRILAYGDGRIDVITCCLKERGDLITPDITVPDATTLTSGVHYRILTTTTAANRLGLGRVVDDSFISDGTELTDTSNTVVIMRTSHFVFRSEDYGQTFSYFDLDNKYNGIGGWGTVLINHNCIEKKQLFLGLQTSETTDYNASPGVIEFSNIALFDSKID